MKVKHLLFSSLVLSVGFAACTSDVEEFSAQTPVTNPEGIELGEGFSFQVKNAGFGADAETRAHFDKEGTSWKASWDNTDKVGAAMYSMVTGLISDTNNEYYGKPGYFHNCLTATPNTYFSNNEFAYQKEEGEVATFTSATNSMVGAYILYYPYDVTLNQQKAFTQIPVYSGAKAPNATSNLIFDAANVEKEVNNRIFAATIAKFEDNTNNAPIFQLQQIPNLYMVKFALADHLMLTLKEPVKIERIVMEAKKGSASAININGYVEPKVKNVEAKHFNRYKKTDNPVTCWDLGGIKFNGSVDAPNLTITPENVPEESRLHINALGKEERTDPYYFSALPLDEGVIDEIRFTIVAKVNGVDKVFTKVFNAAEDVMKKDSKVVKSTDPLKYYSNWELLTMRAQGMGEVINLGVVLDTEDESNQIYTIGQFADKWAKGQTTFDFAVAGLKFDDDNFGITEFTSENGNIVFQGAEQKLAQNITTTKGSFTFNNKITIDGNVTADEKAISFAEDATIIGDVTADGATITFDKGATIMGNVVTLNGGKVIFNSTTTVTKSAADATDGIINVAQGTEVEFNGQATVGKISNAGNVTFGGKTATGDITSTGGSIELTYEASGTNDIPSIGNIDATATTVTLKKANITSVKAVNSTITTVAGTVINGDVNVEGEDLTLNATVNGNLETNGVVLKGASAITGNANLKNTVAEFGSVTVEGTMTVDVESQIKKGTITAGTLSVYGDVVAGVKVNSIATLNVKTTGVVNVAGTKATVKIGTVNIENGVSKSGVLTANNIVLGDINNNGTLDGTFSVDGTFEQNGTADAAVITLTKQTDKEGYEIAHAILKVNVDMNTAGITNNGEVIIMKKLTGKIQNNAVITVNGTLEETAADELTMTDESIINVNAKASLIYNATSAKKAGYVYLQNCFIEVPTVAQQNIITYVWAKTAPEATKTAPACNRITIDGASVTDTNKSLLDGKVICLLAGGMKISSANPDFALTSTLIVSESASITTTSTKLKTFTITGANNYVAEGKTFTLDDKLSLNGGTLRLTKDAKFEGNVGTATVQHVASL